MQNTMMLLTDSVVDSDPQTIGRDALQRVVRTASSMQAAVLIRNWAPSDVAEIRIVRVDHPNPRKTANDAHF